MATTTFGTTLRPIFGALENFQRELAILVAPSTDVTMKPLVRCKAHLVL